MNRLISGRGSGGTQFSGAGTLIKTQSKCDLQNLEKGWRGWPTPSKLLNLCLWGEVWPSPKSHQYRVCIYIYIIVCLINSVELLQMDLFNLNLCVLKTEELLWKKYKFTMFYYDDKWTVFSVSLPTCQQRCRGFTTWWRLKVLSWRVNFINLECNIEYWI